MTQHHDCVVQCSINRPAVSQGIKGRTLHCNLMQSNVGLGNKRITFLDFFENNNYNCNPLASLLLLPIDTS